MNKNEIVDTLARERVVEQMVLNITGMRMDAPDAKDLSQIVYMILLEYEEERIVELWEAKQINFFIARVIKNQFNHARTTYKNAVHKLRDVSTDLDHVQGK